MCNKHGVLMIELRGNVLPKYNTLY